MLNPFPIQFLALFGYFILRVIIGMTLLSLSLTHYQYRHELRHVFALSWWPYGRTTTLLIICAEIIVGSLLILGAYTQYAALALIIMSSAMLIMRNRFNHTAIPQKLSYLLFFAAGLSLFITGAGALAFDLPI